MFDSVIHSSMLNYSWRGGLSLRDFNEVCSKRNVEGVKVRNAFKNNGHFWKNQRAYAYAVHCDSKKRDQYEKFGLEKAEAVRVYRALPTSALVLTEFSTKGFRPRSIEFIDDVIARIAVDMQKYIRAKVNRKLQFLVSHWNLDANDLHRDLLEDTILTLYSYYPEWRSLEDLMKVSNANLHNVTENLIAKYTADRNCPYPKKDGRIQITRQATDENSDENQAQSFAHDSSALEAKISVSQLLRSQALNLRQKKFLSLLTAAEEDTAFSEWLGCNNVIWATSLPMDKLIPKVCEYMNISKSKGLRFLQSLQFML